MHDASLTYWELARLEPSWDNVEALLHRLWGQASNGEYRKREWAVLQRMLLRLRLSPSAECALCPTHSAAAERAGRELAEREAPGVVAWLASFFFRR